MFAYQFVVTPPGAEARDRDPKPKVVVVMPAYNAAKTLHMTYAELPRDVVDLVILVDDGSTDETAQDRPRAGPGAVRPRPQLRLRRQPEDLLPRGAEGRRRHRRDGPPGLPVRPDAAAGDRSGPSSEGEADVVLGSRLLGGEPDQAGHAVVEVSSPTASSPALENRVFGLRLSEYHTGYRAFRREVLESVNLRDELRQLHLRPGDHGADRRSSGCASPKCRCPRATSRRPPRRRSCRARSTGCPSSGCWRATCCTARAWCASGSSTACERRYAQRRRGEDDRARGAAGWRFCWTPADPASGRVADAAAVQSRSTWTSSVVHREHLHRGRAVPERTTGRIRGGSRCGTAARASTTSTRRRCATARRCFRRAGVDSGQGVPHLHGVLLLPGDRRACTCWCGWGAARAAARGWPPRRRPRRSLSPSFLLIPLSATDARLCLLPQRLGVLVRYGEGPHMTAFAVLPLALACGLVRAAQGAARRRWRRGGAVRAGGVEQFLRRHGAGHVLSDPGVEPVGDRAGPTACGCARRPSPRWLTGSRRSGSRRPTCA